MSNDPKKNDQRPNGNNNNENDIKGRRILFLVLAALIATLLINTLYTSISKSYLTEVRYDEFLTMLDNGEISELEFQSDDRVVYAKKSDTDSSGAAKKLYYTGLIPNQDTTALTDKLDEKGVKYNRELPEETSPIVSFVVSLAAAGDHHVRPVLAADALDVRSGWAAWADSAGSARARRRSIWKSRPA